MKFLSPLILIFLAFIAEAQTSDKPKIDFTNSGIHHINKISFTDTSTVVEVQILFLPNWWSTFSDKAYLENSETGDRYTVKAIEGASFNEKIWTPKSGDTLVKLIFPKLDKKLKKVNYGDEGTTYIYGISLHEKANSKRSAYVSKDIQKWLNDKTSFTKNKEKESGFFVRDSIKIVGYIKGYDKRASFASGIIYHKNIITNEDLPTTVRIYEDGRFECSMLATHPISSYIIFDNQRIGFYAEPGTTTGIILDWNEFLLTFRYRDRSYKIKNIEFLGKNKLINEQLASIEIPRPDYGRLDGYRKEQKPEDFKIAQVKNWDNARKTADSTMLAKQMPNEIKRKVANDIDLVFANFLFDYESSRTYYQQQEPNNEILKLPMPDDYFDFLSKIDLNDQSLLVSDEFSTFINRFEFSPAYGSRFSFRGKRVDGYKQLDSSYIARNKKTNLVYDIAKLRSLASDLKFNQYKQNPLNEETSLFLKTIGDPFLISQLNTMYEKYKVGNVAYDLPNTDAAAVFKKIINPLKGKILIVDFWAQWCGPCLAGIEKSLELRTKYKDNPDFTFVYVTDESTSAGFYDEYTKKNLMINTHRVKADEYLALRELFKFNGIPRYILVNAEGQIQNDDFASYSLQSEFSRYFPEKFSGDYWK